jgi:hypothetical protein
MRILVAVILSANLAIGSYAQSTAHAITESVAQRRLDEKVPIWITDFNVTGIAIAYIENGNLTGSDAEVKTLAFLLPQRQTGVVIFTDGPDVGHQAIDEMVRVLYPNHRYARTLWPN